MILLNLLLIGAAFLGSVVAFTLIDWREHQRFCRTLDRMYADYERRMKEGTRHD